MSNFFYIENTVLKKENVISWLDISQNDYTTDLSRAGLFLERQAEKICKNNNFLIAWPETYIKKHTRLAVHDSILVRNRAKFKRKEIKRNVVKIGDEK